MSGSPTDRAPRRRARRALQVVVAAVLAVGVVLTGLVLVGHYVFHANLLPGQSAMSGTTGAEIYRANCAQCHGTAGEGGQFAIRGPAFIPGGALSTLTFSQRVARITDGKPLAGMPAWGIGNKLTPEQIRRVAAYTQILSGQDPKQGVEGVR
ncbi:MAG: cytochrome c [Frankia sp.]|nr:cytochrome c [Frankia sp.]